MRRTRDPIAEIDLLAYADGLLDTDFQRKKEVEQYLSDHPESERYVSEIREQNDAIRVHYAFRLAEPVPEHLTAALHSDRHRSTRGRTAMKAASIAVLLLTSSVAGWLIGQSDQEDEWGVTDFVERAANFHPADVAEMGDSQVAAAGSGFQPLGWLNRRIALELAAPDLTAVGFDLVAKERLGPTDDPMVRLVYERLNGITISLFLRPRWEENASPISTADETGATVQYWLDGPLAFAMTTNAPEAETGYLAQVIREAVRRARLNDGASAMALSPGATATDPAAQIGEGDRNSMTVPSRPTTPASGNGVPQQQIRQFN